MAEFGYAHVNKMSTRQKENINATNKTCKGVKDASWEIDAISCIIVSRIDDA